MIVQKVALHHRHRDVSLIAWRPYLRTHVTDFTAIRGDGEIDEIDRLLEHHHLKLDHLEIDHAIQVMRPEISSLLLRKWDFDNELIRVTEECGDWSRKRLEAADLCDLVLVANYYALLHSDTNHTLPRAEAVPAIDKLGITPQQAIAALRESTEIKRNIKKLFI